MNEQTREIVHKLVSLQLSIIEAKKNISKAETIVYQNQNKHARLKKKQKEVMRDLHIVLGYYQS